MIKVKQFDGAIKWLEVEGIIDFLALRYYKDISMVFINHSSNSSKSTRLFIEWLNRTFIVCLPYNFESHRGFTVNYDPSFSDERIFDIELEKLRIKDKYKYPVKHYLYPEVK